MLVAGPDVVRHRAVAGDLARRDPRRPCPARNGAQPRAATRRAAMFFVRPIARDDLPAVLALSERTGNGLTTLPANRERLLLRIDRSLASFAGTAEKANACYMFVLVEGSAGDHGTRRRHQRDRGGGRAERALVQLSRRHARPRVARARRVHGRADAVPVQRPHRAHRALLAVPRPALSHRQERRAARQVPAAVHRRVRAISSRRRSSPSCAAGSSRTGRARSGKDSAAISSRWNIRRPTT